jgi:hypothetical protein
MPDSRRYHRRDSTEGEVVEGQFFRPREEVEGEEEEGVGQCWHCVCHLDSFSICAVSFCVSVIFLRDFSTKRNSTWNYFSISSMMMISQQLIISLIIDKVSFTEHKGEKKHGMCVRLENLRRLRILLDDTSGHLTIVDG